jgi:thiamine biosynthesis lipoprotein
MMQAGPLWLAGLAGVPLAPVVAMAQDQACCFETAMLGAPATFIFMAPSREIGRQAAWAARAEIDRLDRLLSFYRGDSELSRLNAARSMIVSPDVFAVLDQAETLRAQTGGAFSGRLGKMEGLWRAAKDAPPEDRLLRRAAEMANEPVELDRASLRVSRPSGVTFAVDALAKGYIIDRAVAVARAAAPLSGLLIDIGGDMRCYGSSGAGNCWPVGLPDPRLPFVNAPLVSRVFLRNQAIATSGCGPRDRMIGGKRYSVTLSPKTGRPVEGNLAVTAVAPTAAQADGLATALLVLEPHEGLALVERETSVAARVTGADGRVHASRGWAPLEAGPGLLRIAAPASRGISVDSARGSSGPPIGSNGWPTDWALQIFYDAPPINMSKRSVDFRSPYMVMWISDKQNKPVRTLVLVGKDPQYQKDNYIWWGLYGDRAPNLVELRSTATALEGRYPTFWPGYDDSWKFAPPPGDYLLNIESSQEHGQHTFRSIPITLGRSPFTRDVPPSADGERSN